MGLRMDKMAIGADAFLPGCSGVRRSDSGVSLRSAAGASSLLRDCDRCSMVVASSLKGRVGLDSSGYVSGMCRTVQELSTPMASGGRMPE